MAAEKRQARPVEGWKFIHSTPAGTSHTVRFTRSVSLCNLQVHPTVAGRTGNG